VAVGCSGDRAGLGAWRPAEARGEVVGRDLASVAYDGDPEGAYAEPPLATWAVDWGKAGTILADMLIQRVLGAPADRLQAKIEPTFLDRGSASFEFTSDPSKNGAEPQSQKGGDS